MYCFIYDMIIYLCLVMLFVINVFLCLNLKMPKSIVRIYVTKKIIRVLKDYLSVYIIMVG